MAQCFVLLSCCRIISLHNSINVKCLLYIISMYKVAKMFNLTKINSKNNSLKSMENTLAKCIGSVYYRKYHLYSFLDKEYCVPGRYGPRHKEIYIMYVCVYIWVQYIFSPPPSVCLVFSFNDTCSIIA